MEHYISFSTERISAMPCRKTELSTSFAVGGTFSMMRQKKIQDQSPSNTSLYLNDLSEAFKRPRKRLRVETLEQGPGYQDEYNSNDMVQRRKLTEEQKGTLEDIFSRKRYLDRLERLMYSKQLGIPELQILRWFQNKRFIVRRQLLRRCGCTPKYFPKSISRIGDRKPQKKAERCDEVESRHFGDVLVPGINLRHEDYESKKNQTKDNQRYQNQQQEFNFKNDYYRNHQVWNEKLEYLCLPRVSQVFSYDVSSRSMRLTGV